MGYYTLATLRTDLVAELPTGLATTALLNQAIKDAVAYCGSWISDTERAEFVGDGATRRFALPGQNVMLADAAFQETPIGTGNAGVAAPSTTPVLSGTGSGGTFPAGACYGAYSFITPQGESAITPVAAVTLALNNSLVFPAVALPANVTGRDFYASPSAFNPDLQLVGTSTSAAAVTFATPPSATAGRPTKDYIGLFATYNPAIQLEQDVTVAGLASVGTATLTLGVAPALHDRFRVVFTCAPALPINDGDVIRVPEQTIRLAALMFAFRTLAYLHESGDTTQYLSAYNTLDLLVQDLQKKTPTRPRPRPRMPSPTSA